MKKPGIEARTLFAMKRRRQTQFWNCSGDSSVLYNKTY